MATYEEIPTVWSSDALANDVQVAITVKAHALLSAAPSSAQAAWANAALSNTAGMTEKLLKYCVAANKSADVAAIIGASDAAIQNNVDAAVDALIAGGITS